MLTLCQPLHCLPASARLGLGQPVPRAIRATGLAIPDKSN